MSGDAGALQQGAAVDVEAEAAVSITGPCGLRRSASPRGPCVRGLLVHAHVVLERDVLRGQIHQVDHDVVDLLVVQRALEADAPRGHDVPALCDHLVDVVGRVDRRVARRTAPPQTVVRFGGIRERGARSGSMPPRELGSVAADAADAELVLLGEQLDGACAAIDRVDLAGRSSWFEVRARARRASRGDPDHEEDHAARRPSPGASAAAGSRGRRRRARAACPAGCRGRSLARPRRNSASPAIASDDQRAADREDDPCALRAVRASVSSASLSRRHAEGALRRLVDRVGAAGRSEDTSDGVDHDVAAADDLTWKRSMPAGRRAELVLAGGVVLRAVARALEPLRLAAERARGSPRCTHRWYSGMMPSAATPSVS